MPLLLMPIVLMLAASGPLVIGVAYGTHRIIGSLAGAAWVLFAAFFAGMNGDVGATLALAYPLQTVALFSVLAAAFYVAGPKSAPWIWLAGTGPVRLLARAVCRVFARWGVSQRGAGELVSAAIALLILAPIAVYTVKPHPAYAYAIKRFEAELAARLPDTAELVRAEWERVLLRAREDGKAIGRKVAVDARPRISEIAGGAARRARALAGPNAERRVEEVLDDFNSGFESTAEEAIVSGLLGALNPKRNTVEQASRNAMRAVQQAAALRAPEEFAREPIRAHYRLFLKRLDECTAEMSKVGSEIAAVETQRIVDEVRESVAAEAHAAAQAVTERAVAEAKARLKEWL